MELNPPITFDALGWDPWLRLGGAAIAGLLLGLDREVRGHGAGLRTHAILCFSAALVTVCALALYYQLGGEDSRIVFSKGEVKNLTTAAHIWLAAAIGIAFGAGLYPIAVIGTLGSVLLLTLFGWIELRAFRKSNGQD
jgi:putative Mg2+ transporter-C (MgtC) family protein